MIAPTAPAQPVVKLRERVNIVDRVTEMAARFPKKHAVVWPVSRRGREVRYQSVTFAELIEEIDACARGLRSIGVARGHRCVVFVKPGLDFFAIVFALFKLGAVPVLIDPGIGKQQMRASLAEVESDAFIGVPIAHVFRKLYPQAFRKLRATVTVGRRWFWGGHRLRDIRRKKGPPIATEPTRAEDVAAILFTSGSTGPAKGVIYTHGVFDAQIRSLRDHFGFSESEKDLPTFPLFALFDAALGMTAVLPDMDFTKPGSVDPRRIIEPIIEFKITHMFGSPALLDRVSRYGVETGAKLPTLRRVITAGAPVSPDILERMHGMLSRDAEILTPYGATECLPVASIGSREILAETRSVTAAGGGTCVGKPMPELTVRVISISDDPIEEWNDQITLPTGRIGEIVVKGDVATRAYHHRPDATRAAKIRDGDDVWHRMGDVGYFDETGRLWFCGRKAHRVITRDETLFTVPCEAIFNQHPAVLRSALVGLSTGNEQQPVICIELEASSRNANRDDLARELLTLARTSKLTANIRRVLFHPAFPVDVRHNSKIFREKLAIWAARQPF